MVEMVVGIEIVGVAAKSEMREQGQGIRKRWKVVHSERCRIGLSWLYT